MPNSISMRLFLLIHVGMMVEAGCDFDLQVEIRKNTGKPVAPNLDLARCHHLANTTELSGRQRRATHGNGVSTITGLVLTFSPRMPSKMEPYRVSIFFIECAANSECTRP